MKKWLLLGFSLLLSLAFALPSSDSYQCLRLDGNGYASITDANQAGLDMGLSDFMVEGRIRTTYSAALQNIIEKYESGVSAVWFRVETNGYLKAKIYDGTNGAEVLASSLPVNDGRWYYVVFVVDRSSATGLKVFVHGVETSYTKQEDPTSIEDLENAEPFYVGGGSDRYFVGLTDELRVWNFGYDGLPSDYADYITWRSQGRNVFKDISEYDSGSWNCYADADRTEKVTDSGIEAWDNNTPDDWDETNESAGVRDITKESTEKHGGSFAAKLQATNNDGTYFRLSQTVSLSVNKYYELSGYLYFHTRTAGKMQLQLYNSTDIFLVSKELLSTNPAYAIICGVAKPTVVSSFVYAVLHLETTSGIAYFDDIYVKRTGLVGHWKFEGDYLDEGSNDNDLTAGGTGNVCGLGYTLKKVKIISPQSVW